MVYGIVRRFDSWRGYVKNKKWFPGDPCTSCGSTNTGWNPIEGGVCYGCGACDSDE